ncbi:MAG: acetylornithine/succinylornithine family transaminase [bacterium]|nr:acetylornithine/succinylornithine family transaminase [Candidatus Kapabacteria bacterium]
MIDQTASSLSDREHRSFIPTYKRLPLEVERAEGMYIFTADGRRYLDFLGGIAVNSLGHCHPSVVAAVEKQLHRYAHVSNYFYQDAQIEFAEALREASAYDRVFLTNSGTEATDGAMKFARMHGSANGRSEIIGFSGGFHGRTYGALSIMDKPGYKDGMGPFLPATRVIPYNDASALEDTVGNDTCALMIEFLQGEGGIREVDAAFVARMFELREKFGFLVIADEVQAGGGRTGRFFSFEQFGVRPDIVTVAKGLGGGLPLGAILIDESLASVWSPGRHGTTFGGNALACAAGSAMLGELRNGLMERVAKVGEYAVAQLNTLRESFPALIKEVRGAGAMIGVELSMPAATIVDAMLERGVIVNATDETVLRLLPPMIYERRHVDEMVAVLNQVLRHHAAL